MEKTAFKNRKKTRIITAVLAMFVALAGAIFFSIYHFANATTIISTGQSWLTVEQAGASFDSAYKDLIKNNNEFSLDLNHLTYVQCGNDTPNTLTEIKNTDYITHGDWKIVYMTNKDMQPIDENNKSDMLVIAVERNKDSATPVTRGKDETITLYYTNVYSKIDNKYVNVKITINSVTIGQDHDYTGKSGYASVLRITNPTTTNTTIEGNFTQVGNEGLTGTCFYSYDDHSSYASASATSSSNPAYYSSWCTMDTSITIATYQTETNISNQRDASSAASNWSSNWTTPLNLQTIYNVSDIDTTTEVLGSAGTTIDDYEGATIGSGSNIVKALLYNEKTIRLSASGTSENFLDHKHTSDESAHGGAYEGSDSYVKGGVFFIQKGGTNNATVTFHTPGCGTRISLTSAQETYPTPTKTVTSTPSNETYYKNNEKITFTITENLGTAYSNGGNLYIPYTSYHIGDILPSNLSLDSAIVSLEGTDITNTSDYGELKTDTANNTVYYDFNSSGWISNLGNYTNQTIKMTVTATVNDTSCLDTPKTATNIGYSTINDIFESSAVTVNINNPTYKNFAISKTWNDTFDTSHRTYITVNLKPSVTKDLDGNTISTKTVTLNAGNSWTATVSDCITLLGNGTSVTWTATESDYNTTTYEPTNTSIILNDTSTSATFTNNLKSHYVYYYFKKTGSSTYELISNSQQVVGDKVTVLAIPDSKMTASTAGKFYKQTGYTKRDVAGGSHTTDDINAGGEFTMPDKDVYLYAEETETVGTYTVHYMYKKDGKSYEDMDSTTTGTFDSPYTITHAPSEYKSSETDAATYTAKSGWTLTYNDTDEWTANTYSKGGTYTMNDSTGYHANVYLWSTEDSKIKTYTVHYMFASKGGNSFTETRTVPDVPYGSYTTLATGKANITNTTGYTLTKYAVTSNNSAPTSDSSYMIVPETGTTNVSSNIWIWMKEIINQHTVYYKYQKYNTSTYTDCGIESKTYNYGATVDAIAEYPSGSTYVTPDTAANTYKRVGWTYSTKSPDAGGAYIADNYSPGDAGFTMPDSDVYLYAKETTSTNTYTVHYMFDAKGDGSFTDVKQETNVEYGLHDTLSLASAGINATTGYTLVSGYVQTPSSAVPSSPSYSITPGTKITVEGDTWLWITESANEYSVYYYYKKYNGAYERVAVKKANTDATYVPEYAPSEYATTSTAAIGIAPMTSWTYYENESSVGYDNSGKNYAAGGSGFTMPAGNVYLYSKEEPSYSKATVHYMFIEKGKTVKEKRTDTDVLYGDYVPLSLADVGVTASDGYVLAGGYAQSPSNVQPVSPSYDINDQGSGKITIDGDTWLWITETPNTYNVYYYYKKYNGSYVKQSDVGTAKTDTTYIPEYDPSKYATMSTATFAITPKTNWTYYDSESSVGYNESGTNYIKGGSGFMMPSHDVYLYSTEDLEYNSYTVHYMYKKIGENSYKQVSEGTGYAAKPYKVELDPVTLKSGNTTDYTVLCRGDWTCSTSGSDSYDENGTNYVSDQEFPMPAQEIWLYATEKKAALEIEKSVVPAKINADETKENKKTVTWTITIKNTGEVPISGLMVTDQLLKERSITIVPEESTLAAGATTKATAQMTLLQSDIDVGSVTNSATVNGNETYTTAKSTIISNESSETVNIVQSPSISVEKTATPSVSIGDTIYYQITITNTGNVTLKDVVLNDAIADITDRSIGTLTTKAENKDTATVTIEASIKATENDAIAKTKENIATVTAKDPNGTIVEGTGSATTTVLAHPSIYIVKSTTQSEIANPKVGDIIEYGFYVENDGDITVSNISPTDALLANSGVVLALPSKTLSPNAKTSTNATYRITQDDIDRGYVVNTVGCIGIEPVDKKNVDAADNEKSVLTVKTLLGQHADLTVEKEANVSSAKIGTGIEYTITVTNTGNVTLRDVTLNDELTGIEKMNVGTLTTSSASAVRSCTTITTTYDAVTEKDAKAGKVTNTVTVNATAPDGCETMSTKEASAETVVVSSPSVSLTKMGTLNKNGTNASASSTVDWYFIIENTGDVTLEDVTINDPLLLSYNKIAVPEKSTLEPGSKTYAYATTPVSQSNINNGEITNTATVSAVSVVDNCAVTDDANATVSLVRNAGLEVTKNVDHSTARIGDTVIYTIEVTNVGSVTLSPVTITDELIGLTNEQVADKLEPGSSADYIGSYVIKESDAVEGSVTNVVTAHGTPPSGMTSPVDPRAEATVEVESDSSLVLTKTVEPQNISPAQVGDEVTWNFTVKNTGDLTVNDIEIEDELLTDLGIEIEPTEKENETVSLAPNESCSFIAVQAITQKDIDTGEIVNAAFAAGNDSKGNTVQSNGDEATVSLGQEGKLLIEKNVDAALLDPGRIGDALTYTFKVTNNSNFTISDIEIVDDIDGLEVKWANEGISVLAPGEYATATAIYYITDDDFSLGYRDNTAYAQGKTPSGETIVSKESTAITKLTKYVEPASDLINQEEEPNILPATGQNVVFSISLLVILTGIIIVLKRKVRMK